MNMQSSYPVVIAGAGPGGALLARELAAAKIPVAVFERKEPSDLGHNWSDAVEKIALAAAGFEIPKMAGPRYQGKLVKAHEADDNLFEPHIVKSLQIRFPDLSGSTRNGVEFRYITTDRKVLNRRLAQQAAEAGAAFFYGHRADALIGDTDADLENIHVKGLRVTDMKTGAAADISAEVVVDATGYLSGLRTRLRRAPAVSREFKGGDLAYACRTVRRIDEARAGTDDLTDHYRYGAFKGYFWTHLHHSDVVDVGGGVREEPGRIDPLTVVREMIAQRPSITDEELRGGGGIVLVGRSPYSLAAGGFVAVGDAAGQVIPTTGCGVGGALTGALLASKTIQAALKRGACTLDALWPYNFEWFSGCGSHFAALAALKEILQDLSHEDITFLMKKDIMSGEMLTPTINGVFEAPDLPTMVKTLINGISRPGLLMKLNRATTFGRKIFRHYRNYPQKWDASGFEKWVKTTDAFFSAIT
jgi:digeranylgeranylglycerophospholipid reductase